MREDGTVDKKTFDDWLKNREELDGPSGDIADCKVIGGEKKNKPSLPPGMPESVIRYPAKKRNKTKNGCIACVQAYKTVLYMDMALIACVTITLLYLQTWWPLLGLIFLRYGAACDEHDRDREDADDEDEPETIVLVPPRKGTRE